MRLETLTWPEAEAALRDAPLVLLPLGARLKEHGHHLPLNNDWLMAEALTARVLARREVLTAPTIQVGYYPAFVNYPGSLHLRLSTATALVLDCVRSLARHTDARFYVLNTGISTNRSLEPARLELQAEGVTLDYTDLGALHRAVEAEQPRGSHADELETSMMMVLAPEVVRPGLAQRDCNERRGPGPFTRDANAASGLYSPTGAWGDPTLATREKGERLVDALVAHILEGIDALLAEDCTPPPPRERYLPASPSP